MTLRDKQEDNLINRTDNTRTRVLANKQITPAQKVILLTCLEYGNFEHCNLRTNALARVTGLSNYNIRRHINRLLELGYISYDLGRKGANRILIINPNKF